MASARALITAAALIARPTQVAAQCPTPAGARVMASQRSLVSAAVRSDANIGIIRQDFKKQASLYAPHPKPMAFVMSEVGSVSGAVLDVASGTGAFAIALAPLATQVVSFDATEEMQKRAKTTAREHGHTNIEFTLGDASSLPYSDSTFDLVVCRLAIHHFTNPGTIVAEMARVCKPGGHVVLADILGDDNSEQHMETDRLEILRDASHTKCPTLAGLHGLLEATGRLQVKPHSGNIYMHPVPAHWWMDNSETEPAAREEIDRCLRAEIAGGKKTGMQPHLDEHGVLTFLHRYAVAQGVRMP